MQTRPILGITMGDAAGVGPEVILKALNEREIYEVCRPIVIGDAGAFERVRRIIGSSQMCSIVKGPSELRGECSTVEVLDLHNVPADLPFGKIDAGAGRAAYECVARAVDLAMKGEIQAIVTAPLNKQALNLGGHAYPGHTEILAHLSETKDYAMLLVGQSLRVIHVTTHVALRQACQMIKKERVLSVIQLADLAMKKMGYPNARIAVAGLNPHAGEGGLLGKEEMEEIMPAIVAAQELGFCAIGPFPPDTVFHRTAVRREFDIVVAMLHDQGHIALKMLNFETGVNVTLGLPFIRTSVDHGTAFDIAGTGRADSRSMSEAMLLAAHMAGSEN